MKRKWIKQSIILVVLGLLTIFIFFKDPNTSNHKISNQAVALPSSLNSIVKEKSSRLIQQAAKKGIVVVITDGFRSFEDQNRLYQQGRTTSGNIVTNAKAGESYHNYGLAIDFALRTPSGNVIWDRQYDGNRNGKADWTEVVEISKSLGFQWGGDWTKFKDYPHLQMDFGLTIADLQNGKRPDQSSLVADKG
ncbi:M15 family metallopeptidase [Neobacillus sp. PS3-12]|jgi:peptidoglycan LD-endopeptidase CwlK|uniref:M15 family metallopeptidase n=1 Tax=Neobacillus sp. PS3-12 TaxID=3070677 RepID=UPI0027E20CC3|nr:M15 family metallopeptidase [Neobacillus sp. PS3-12]WML53196.1 M15 family metallopeptidase [Neobacillus sp. PS3-12]